MTPKSSKKKSLLRKKLLKSARTTGRTRRLARATVQQSRDFLRQVIDIAPHFIFAKDRDGRFTLANQAVADAYGTMIEELIGKTDADFNSKKAEVEFFLKMDREVMDSKKERFIPEEVITDATGKRRWLQTIKRPIIGKNGRAYQVLGVSTDITERKKAEEALRASEQRFHAIYDHTYEFIGLLAPDGTLIDVNQTALAFRGLQRADVVGKPFWETPWWDLSRELQEKLKAAVADAAKGEFVRLRAQHQDQGGVIEEIDFSVTPIKDRTGRVTQIIPEGRRITPLTKVLDQLREAQAGLEHRVRERTAALTQLTEQLRAEITERKVVEGQLHQSEERLNLAIRLAKLGIFDHDHRTETLYWSPTMREIYGVPSGEPASLDGYIQLIHPHDRDAIVGAIRRAHAPSGDGLYTVEHRLLRRDGTVRWVSLQSRTLFEGDGPTRTPVRTMGAMMDITERKRAEEAVREKQVELQQSQAQLQDLTAKLFTAQDNERQRIARDLHDDFSQRLAAVAIDVASLQRQPPLLPELIGKALEPIREELQQLSTDLHDLAYRLHPPLLRHLGLQAAIEDYLHKAIERTGIRITLRARDVPGSIPLDWSICLFRVLQESLQNVVKHAGATEVQVRLSGSSKGIGLSVIDNGKGFDAGDRSSHQKGLGLTSMQERLRLLNGFLNIHSRLADGTKICTWIPFPENTA